MKMTTMERETEEEDDACLLPPALPFIETQLCNVEWGLKRNLLLLQLIGQRGTFQKLCLRISNIDR